VKNIKWNEVTWYSKLAAIIVFLLFLPILTFYIGTQYQKTIDQNLDNVSSYILPLNKVSDLGSTSTQKTMTIKVALLATQLDSSNKKDFRGCDLLVKQVPYSTTPLESALKELFQSSDSWNPGDLVPSNFIASQKDLHFDKVILENGVAKIYMTGKVGPLSGVCDDQRLKFQLEETALQFPTVKSVEFYLNNRKENLVVSEKGN
jgi:hypothetical protein